MLDVASLSLDELLDKLENRAAVISESGAPYFANRRVAAEVDRRIIRGEIKRRVGQDLLEHMSATCTDADET